MKRPLKETGSAFEAASFFKGHQLIIGLVLVFFGGAGSWYLMANFQGTYVLYADWRTFLFYTIWSVSFPVLLLMALVGTLVLSIYSVRNIRPSRTDKKEYTAFLVTALGFTYVVIGAWPLWTQPYTWIWQRQIAAYGNLLVLPLYAGSIFAFVTGTISVYIHSRVYHQQHPEIADTKLA